MADTTNPWAPLLEMFAPKLEAPAAPISLAAAELAIPSRSQLLGRLLSAALSAHLGRAFIAWRNWLVVSALARKLSKSQELCKAQASSSDKQTASIDKQATSNERWKAREKSKLDSLQKQIGEERDALNDERRKTRLEASALQRREVELHAKLDAKRQELHYVGSRHGAAKALGAVCKLVTTVLARYLREWSHALSLMRADARRAAATAHIDELQLTIKRVEARPLKNEEDLANEQRMRQAAEQARWSLEVQNTRLRREAAAAPAIKERERERARMISGRSTDKARSAEAETMSLARACKMSAMAGWLRAMRRESLRGCMYRWATSVRHQAAAETAAAACKAAERKGYARALTAALAAEKAAKSAGDGEERARSADWQRQLDDAWYEVRQAEVLREAEAAKALAAAQAAEARVQAANMQAEEMAAQCAQAEERAAVAQKQHQAAEWAAQDAAAVVDSSSGLLNNATQARKRAGATRILSAACVSMRLAWLHAMHTWRYAALELAGIEIIGPLKTQLRAQAALAEKRADKARNVLRAEQEVAQAEQAHEEELRQVAKMQVLSSRREYAERSRRAAAEHAARRREQELKATQPVIAEIAATVALQQAQAHAGGSPQQLAALRVACCACESSDAWRLQAAFFTWSTTACALHEVARLEVLHETTIETLSHNRKELATALLDSEAQRRSALEQGQQQVCRDLACQLAAARAIFLGEHILRSDVASAFGVWARAATSIGWAAVAAAIDTNHVAASLRLARRVGGIAAAAAVSTGADLLRVALRAALEHWRATAIGIARLDEVELLQQGLHESMNMAAVASEGEQANARAKEELAIKHAYAERVAASARTTAGARLEAATREKDDARLQAKKADEALIEQRGQFITAKEELRGAQERLTKERALNEKARLVAQRSQLLRVAQLPRTVRLGFAMATWRMAAVKEQTIREIYGSALAAPPTRMASSVPPSPATVGPAVSLDDLDAAWRRGQTQGMSGGDLTATADWFQQPVTLPPPPTRPLQPRAFVLPPSAANTDNAPVADGDGSGKMSGVLKRRFGRRVAALACAVRTPRVLDNAVLACALVRWQEVSATVAMTEGARKQLTDIAQLMRTAAEGRSNTQRAIRLAGARRCVRSETAVAMMHAFREWVEGAVLVEVADLSRLHSAASEASAVAALEVSRLAVELAKARNLADVRPTHLTHELRERKEAVSAAESGRTEAEARLASLTKSHSALDAQYRVAVERNGKVVKEKKAALVALRADILRRVMYAHGRWWAPRALWLWRAFALAEISRGAVSSTGNRTRRGAALAASHTALAEAAPSPPISGTYVGNAAMGARLLLLSRMLGRSHALLSAFHTWRGLALGVLTSASSQRPATAPSSSTAASPRVATSPSAGRIGGGGGGANERRMVNEERRIVRLKAEAEALKKRLEQERSDQSEAAAASKVALDEAKTAAKMEAARHQKLSKRMSASALVQGIGSMLRCARALRVWHWNSVRIDAQAHIATLSTLATVGRLEAACILAQPHSLFDAMRRWREAVVSLEAVRVLEAERVKGAHVSRMLQGARGQLAQRTRLPLKLEEDLSAAKSALGGEASRAKEAASQLAMATRQLEASKAQRDALEAELKRSSTQLKATQKELTRRTPTIDAVVQAGGDGGDDEGSLIAIARAQAAATEAKTSAARAAPYRVAVLLRLLQGMPASAPMRLATALGTWRLVATHRRQRLVHGAVRQIDVQAQWRLSAEVRSLVDEIRLAEEAASSAAALLLNRVVVEREKRQGAESELRRATTPLALQEQANRMKEALQLEVIARQAAEAKAQRAVRQHSAVDSQLRIANETVNRLQREQQRAAATGASGRAGVRHAPNSPGTPTTNARIRELSSVITGASSRIVDGRP